MNFFDWIESARQMTSAALTVRAQSVSPNDNGQLLWDAIMPRQDIASVDIHELVLPNIRLVGERREWNGPARPFSMPQPKFRDITLNPIELTHKVDEYELQKLAERAGGVNVELFKNVIGASLPDRAAAMAQANYRRIELDVFEAWLTGQITVRNPVDNTSYVASFNFDPARYATAPTAWDNVAVNAYNELVLYVRDVAQTLVGPVSGVMLRQATLNAIVADAPNLQTNIAGIQPTVSQVEQRLTQELGFDFRFFVNERTVNKFTLSNGWAYTAVKVFPAHKVAVIPQGGTVGNTGFAPVLRAMEVASLNPDARVDVNGQVAYRFVKNDGRELQMDVQVNAIPLPNEQRVAVIDVGV